MRIPAGSVRHPDLTAEFRAQVDFLKKLAQASWSESPSGTAKAQEKKQSDFLSLEKPLASELDRFTFQDFKNPGPSFTPMLVKLALYIYLMDKVREFNAAAARINKDGLYALHDAVRGWTYSFLTDGFFRKTADDSIREYLFSEAQFVAMAELSGVELVSVQDAVAAYTPKVFERLAAIVREAEGKKKGRNSGRGSKPKRPKGSKRHARGS